MWNRYMLLNVMWQFFECIDLPSTKSECKNMQQDPDKSPNPVQSYVSPYQHSKVWTHPYTILYLVLYCTWIRNLMHFPNLDCTFLKVNASTCRLNCNSLDIIKKVHESYIGGIYRPEAGGEVQSLMDLSFFTGRGGGHLFVGGPQKLVTGHHRQTAPLPLKMIAP